MMWANGKGDARRPSQVSLEEWHKRWEEIFKKPKEREKLTPEPTELHNTRT